MTAASNPTTVSRRGFLQAATVTGLAVGVTGLFGCAPQSQTAAAENTPDARDSWKQAPEPIEESTITDSRTADVIVVGGGISGVCTAASALENGLSVIVLEKNKQPRMTGLDFGCVNPTIAKEAGLALDDSALYRMARDWVHMSANRARADLVLEFIRNSGPAIDWLVEKATAWGCTPVLAAMKSESDSYYNYIRPVEFPGGPLHDIEAGSYGVNDIITMLREEIEQGGGSYLTETAVEQLEKDGDRVTAAIAKTAEDAYVRFEATKGVVLCAGDFGAHTDMMSELCFFDYDSYDPTGYMNVSTGTGDGHKLGLWAGGTMQMGPQPLMLLPQVYPYFYLRVNDRGERFCNEDCDSVNMCINQLAQHQGKAWAIWDAKWPQEIPASLAVSGGMSWDQDFREYGQPWSQEVEQAMLDYEAEIGNLVTADTLEELAEAAGIAKEGLIASVNRYNELAAQGSDDDFGKRAELMTAIAEPPFYALQMMSSMCVSVGGLEVNLHSQVLDETGAPIEGLYAVGNTAGGLFGVDYNEAPVPGVSLGRCVTFGKLLGEHLARA